MRYTSGSISTMYNDYYYDITNVLSMEVMSYQGIRYYMIAESVEQTYTLCMRPVVEVITMARHA